LYTIGEEYVQLAPSPYLSLKGEGEEKMPLPRGRGRKRNAFPTRGRVLIPPLNLANLQKCLSCEGEGIRFLFAAREGKER
jgi:hypothetical protein